MVPLIPKEIIYNVYRLLLSGWEEWENDEYIYWIVYNGYLSYVMTNYREHLIYEMTIYSGHLIYDMINIADSWHTKWLIIVNILLD